MELSKQDIKALRQLRNLLHSVNISDIDAILERAAGVEPPQPRKRANLKAQRKQDALNYLLGKKKTA